MNRFPPDLLSLAMNTSLIRKFRYVFLFTISLLGLLLASPSLMAQGRGGITGSVLDANTRRPVAGATIQVTEAGRSVLSDSMGRYRIAGLEPGAYTVQVSSVGYEPEFRFNIPISSGNDNELNFDLRVAVTSLGDVTVRASRRNARAATLETPLSVQKLTTEEIKTNPGGNFDISRVVNSLPGVAGSSGSIGGFRNDILIRGGGPGENVFYLDGIEVPVINHFATQGSGGGPTGILNVSFIEEVKLNSSAFDAKYDNALSSVFEFRQKTGNPTRTQGNIRLSGTELAATFEGPLSKKNNITYLASARRSYLQLLFSALDLPIRPNYWDFQYKVTYRPDEKSTLTFLGVAALDEFALGNIREPDQEKLYTLNQVPVINQWSYTFGVSYRRSIKDGYYQLALSRNALDNDNEKYDFNDASSEDNLRLRSNARETENKLRWEVNRNKNGWKISYGGVAQYLQYFTDNNIRVRAAVGSQPEQRYLFRSDIDFWRFGLFVQSGRTVFDDRLGISLGVRSDVNSFTSDGMNPARAFSPRLSLRYSLNNQWSLNATTGRYARIAPYTILGFRDNNEALVNKNNNYITNWHYVIGAEYLPKASTRFTMEAFYKKYEDVPVTLRDGISINNLGANFGSVGNEPVVPTGRGESYGIEFFAQQKLTNRFFGFFSYTFFYSRFSNADGRLAPSAWDNRHLVSVTAGYKLGRNWELGIKYRYQGGAPFTPFDLPASRLNFLTQGQGILDYSRFNSQRLDAFSQGDIRIDKKWNLKRVTIDVYLDISNFWLARSVAAPDYTFERDLQTNAFITTDGQPIRADGSNAIPLILKNDDPVVLPTIGFVIEF